MPFVTPTIPFTVVSERVGNAANVRGPTAAFSALDASIVALPLLGSVSTLASLGFNAGVAPQGMRTLMVSVAANSFENANIAAFTAYAAASAGLRVFVEEFSPRGAFLRSMVGPMTFAYDGRATVFGYEVRLAERHVRAANFTTPVIPGNIYRVWIDSLQHAFCEGLTGPSAAVSNFNFALDPAFFGFLP